MFLEGKAVEFSRFPDLQYPFFDFIDSTVNPCQFDAKTVKKKGERWRAIQTILSSTYMRLKYQATDLAPLYKWLSKM